MKPLLRYLLPTVLLVSAFAAGYALRGQTVHKRGHGHHGSMGPKFVKKLERQLSLSEEQSKSVRKILIKRHQEAMRIREEVRPRFKELRKSAREEIAAILDKEQNAKFTEMIKRHKQRRKKWKGRKSSRWKQDQTVNESLAEPNPPALK